MPTGLRRLFLFYYFVWVYIYRIPRIPVTRKATHPISIGWISDPIFFSNKKEHTQQKWWLWNNLLQLVPSVGAPRGVFVLSHCRKYRFFLGNLSEGERSLSRLLQRRVIPRFRRASEVSELLRRTSSMPHPKHDFEDVRSGHPDQLMCALLIVSITLMHSYFFFMLTDRATLEELNRSEKKKFSPKSATRPLLCDGYVVVPKDVLRYTIFWRYCNTLKYYLNDGAPLTPLGPLNPSV